MSFVEAVRSGFNNYANFNGRALRSEYWWWVLFVLLVSIVANLLDYLFAFQIFRMDVSGNYQGIGIISAIVGLALLIPGLAVSVRRLHDTDRSGWWLLLSFIPIIGSLVLLYFMVISGTPGPNRFGPSRDGSALAFSR